MEVLAYRDTPFDATSFALVRSQAPSTALCALHVIRGADDLTRDNGTRKRSRLAATTTTTTNDWRLEVARSVRGMMRDGVVLLTIEPFADDDDDAHTIASDQVIGRYDVSIWKDNETLSTAVSRLHGGGGANTDDDSDDAENVSYRRRSSGLFVPLIVAYQQANSIGRMRDDWWTHMFGAEAAAASLPPTTPPNNEVEPDQASFWHDFVVLHEDDDDEPRLEDLDLPLTYIVQRGVNEHGWDRVSELIYEPKSETHFVRFSRVTESSVSHVGECFFCGTLKPLQLSITELTRFNAVPHHIGRSCFRQYEFLLRYLDFCSQYTNACSHTTPETHDKLCVELARRYSILSSEAELVFSQTAT